MFAIIIRCPTHPSYEARTTPSACKLCRLAFSVRNEMNKVLSTPQDECTDPNELIIHSVEERKCTR
jgi:hypothetical protein